MYLVTKSQAHLIQTSFDVTLFHLFSTKEVAALIASLTISSRKLVVNPLGARATASVTLLNVSSIFKFVTSATAAATAARAMPLLILIPAALLAGMPEIPGKFVCNLIAVKIAVSALSCVASS